MPAPPGAQSQVAWEGDGGRQVGKGTRGNLLCSGFGSAALIFPEL